MDKKIGLVGYLGYSVDKPIIGGQMSKTRGILQELNKKYENVVSIDTSNWKKEKAKLIKECWKMVRSCNVIIIMPNKNGIKFILPFFAKFKKYFKYKLAYPVVGGWLTGLLKTKKYLAKSIKNVDYILPETVALATELEQYFSNKIDVMPVFSTRTPISEDKLPQNYDEPFTFSTFSRVTPEKGIDEAIRAIELVNSKSSSIRCKLEVWGPIEEGMEEHYAKLFKEKAEFVCYKGVFDGNTLEEFSNYYMMLFPTYYPGEGFPISICESYMAGLPVIASDWRFNKELIEEGNTGFIIPVHDVRTYAEKVDYCIDNVDLIKKMHTECLKKGSEFQPERIMKNLIDWIQC